MLARSLAALAASSLAAAGPLPRIACDWTQPAACLAAAGAPPASFRVDYVTERDGLAWSIDVVTAWAPPYAARFWALARIGYHVGAPLYRVDRVEGSPADSFVAQFGYRGDAAVDALWDAEATSNATWSVHAPGNARGTVAFSMGAATPGEPHGPGDNPNCTDAEYCAVGFSTNIFVNYANNSRLDAPGFSVFGTVTRGMDAVDALDNSYGECAELCGDGTTDPYCVFDAESGQCAGVSMTQLLDASNPGYLDAFPSLDRVRNVSVAVAVADRA